ncbi:MULTISPECIES: HAD family phosphatase [Microbacterium]|uniref:HAD family hydrolase n=1 Tax=Microbacterium TaxID=33882 RepID=UPI000D6451C4|nr:MULTISPECIES: HAD family phosphatase [Microbacterium]
MTTSYPFAAVLFDCDGVLVESELITNGVLHQMLRELGWDLPAEECQRLFVGRSIRDEWEIVYAHTGFRVHDQWLAEFRRRRNEALQVHLTRVPGALEAVEEIRHRVGENVAVATGADRAKAMMQLKMMGLSHLFQDRIFSGMDLARTKPAPDVYLAAAARLGSDPRTVAVVEDSIAGVTAGVAAGATVFGYTPPERPYIDSRQLIDAGAHATFDSMYDLPRVLLSFDGAGPRATEREEARR